ncbi:ABC transporter ATP-binding protein [Nocardioides szechwanensis]|uniref:ATP-binding cassette, subfamily B n=1 Tax=Nocardioides szechwanensis TaxID=1005944 RepID=A0A1H0ALN5_9ACTN|nr:ABC transporter ATP-binding protein [Nocardioides szechwanensis]GEP34821.1 ABC transporter ATP-binding protein [Nocardioides szechwanensis]SDN34224.1 ATP-binding cassette, subfamily B [Nocardioides szechwanensis]
MTATPDSDALEGPPAGVHSLWRLRHYLRPHRGALAVMLGTALAGVGVAIAIPLVTKALIDGPITERDLGPVLPLGLIALALGVLEAVLVFWRRWVQSSAVLAMETEMRRDLYAHLQVLPMGFHSQWQSGQLLSRATTDLSAIRRFAGFGLLFLVINILQVTLVTGVLLHMYWPLGLVVAAAAAPIVWLSTRFEKAYVVVSRRVQDEQGDLATLAEEGAVGIRVIKSFGRSEHVSRQYERAAQQLHETSMDKVRLSAKFWTFLEVIPNLAVVVVLLLGAIGVGTGRLTPGELVAFITLMLSLVWPVASLGFILAMAQEAMTAAARILEIFDTEPDIVSGAQVIERPRGHLRFEHVDFAFPDAPDEPVLRDVNLDLQPGETVALVGATGSGKTILTALVPRLYDVTGGRITIDGVDVRDLELGHLRTLVATAFEEPTLFSMSARENLTLGRADASDADIDEALDIAQAGFARDLPWGLETRIGEQGMALSGGQRQRLALARAVLAQPTVLVLDDTLSALDVHTEKLVEEALRRVLGSTTGLVVAHRASTVLLADKVALIEGGTITHVGGHSELLATVPAYRELLAAEADHEAAHEGARS